MQLDRRARDSAIHTLEYIMTSTHVGYKVGIIFIVVGIIFLSESMLIIIAIIIIIIAIIIKIIKT